MAPLDKKILNSSICKSLLTSEGLAIILLPALLFTVPIALPAIALETDTIDNVQFKEVPGTEGAGININGVMRKQDLVTFDLARESGEYARVEGDCKKGLWRVIRQGGLSTQSSATRWIPEYGSFSNALWEKPSGSNAKFLLFACTVKPNP